MHVKDDMADAVSLEDSIDPPQIAAEAGGEQPEDDIAGASLPEDEASETAAAAVDGEGDDVSAPQEDAEGGGEEGEEQEVVAEESSDEELTARRMEAMKAAKVGYGPGQIDVLIGGCSCLSFDVHLFMSYCWLVYDRS